MRRVLVVIGTRPEAIKLAPVVRALAATRPDLQPVICVTAQHRQMLDQVLELFDLQPDYDLDLMREDQSVTFVTTQVLVRLEELLRKVAPAAVLVQGDTTTSMAAGLAAFYQRIPVGHVEAGLRTSDRYSPFPEEMMRRLLTQLTTYHFAATPEAAATLLAENISLEDVYLTGNPVVDAVLWIRERSPRSLPVQLTPGHRLILVTAHRRESFGEPLRRICAAIQALVDRNPDIEVVYPVHPNPNVQQPVHELLGEIPRVHLTQPLRYDAFIGLMDRSYLILSDSGGVQEEAPVLGKPVLVLREKTERREALQANAAILVGTDTTRIVAEAERLIRDPNAYARMAVSRSPFGDGRAASRIAAILLQALAGSGGGASDFRYRP